MNFILYALGKKFEEYRTCIDWNNVIAVSDKIDTYSSNEYPVPFVSLLTTQLISCSLTPVLFLFGIRSLIFFGKL